MQTLLANLATENRFSWFFPVAIALIGVFAAEVVCIVYLIRKVLAAKKTDSQDQNGGAGASMVFLLITESAIQAREGWLIALAILALIGAVALAALIIFCHFKGFLLAKEVKEPAKKISVFDLLPAKPEEEQPAAPAPDPKEDLHSAMFAFDEPEERDPDQPQVIPVSAYTPPVLFAEEPDNGEEDPEEDAIDELSTVDEDADEEEAEYADPSDDPNLFTGNERIVGYDPETDCNIIERYRKSFAAKLSQSEPQIKRYYSALKNALLSYKGTKSRVSWTADSFHNGRAQIAKINVKTRILELYLALDPASLEGTVYRGQDVGALRKYAETPFRYKIRTPRKFNWALELVHRVCEEHELSPIDIEPVDYESQYPFDTMENLVKRKMVKVTTRLEKVADTFEYDNETEEPEEETVLPAREEQGTNWELDNEVEEHPAAAEPKEPAYGDPVYEEADVRDLPQEEQPEEPEEPTEPEEPEDIPAAAVQPEEKPTWGDQLSLTSEQPDVFFEEQQAGPELAPRGKKVEPDLAQVDVALLDLHFKDGDTVTLEILKRRGLVFSDAKRLKVRATGKMSRRLNIIANQFTYDAIGAINEAGGTAQFIR